MRTQDLQPSQASTISPHNEISTKRQSPEFGGESDFEQLDHAEKQLLNILPQDQRLMSNGLLEINGEGARVPGPTAA